MKVELLRGHPIVLVIGSAIFSVIVIGELLSLLITKSEIPRGIVLPIVTIILFDLIGLIVFYLAYRRSQFAFMSPKKYQKAIKQNEKYSTDIQRLKNTLEQLDQKYRDVSSDEAVNKAIELLGASNRPTSPSKD